MRLFWILLCFWPALLWGKDPEATTHREVKLTQRASQAMVVSAHPLATAAGLAVLQKGGHAVDAALAVQFMLGLVEPQSSGLGGGGFMLVWQAKGKKLYAYDGREVAPKAATGELFMEQKKPMDFMAAFVGGRSVGVPGLLKLLVTAHEKHGVLPLPTLTQPAMETATKGFLVGQRLSGLLKEDLFASLREAQPAAKYFYPNGTPLSEGTLLKNPAYAAVLAQIAKDKGLDFYEGKLARNIIAAVTSHPKNPGVLSLSDLKNYTVKERTPLCQSFRDQSYCSLPPPSGGVITLQILGLLDQLPPLPPTKATDVEGLHRFTQASRLAYADRSAYLADPDFQKVPVKGLLDPTYLKKRAALITEKKDTPSQHGTPEFAQHFRPAPSPSLPSTTHFVVRDEKGNAVSMTSSIEMGFGSTIMVEGFLLNNQLTDFSFTPKEGGTWVANRVEPGKRPRSAMSPLMGFNEAGDLSLLLGSPGGSRIISYVAQTVYLSQDGKLDLQAAITFPRLTNRNDLTALEAATFLPQKQSRFEQLGHQVEIRDLNSGLHGIQIDYDAKGQPNLSSGTDPRREGAAMGY